MREKDVAVIIPVYNEMRVIRGVVEDALKHYHTVICVDDGSGDSSKDEILKTDAYLVQHPINMGQGAALQTGIDFALTLHGIQYFVTFDADGQHSIKDVKTMINKIRKSDFDIVLGSRFLGAAKNITKAKKRMLKLAIKFTNVLSGVNLTDTHNGLRVFNRRFATALEIRMPDMAHASEIIDFMGSGEWKYCEIPITITYSDYSQKKGQSMINSINIAFDMVFSKVGHK